MKMSICKDKIMRVNVSFLGSETKILRLQLSPTEAPISHPYHTPVRLMIYKGHGGIIVKKVHHLRS